MSFLKLDVVSIPALRPECFGSVSEFGAWTFQYLQPTFALLLLSMLLVLRSYNQSRAVQIETVLFATFTTLFPMILRWNFSLVVSMGLTRGVSGFWAFGFAIAAILMLLVFGLLRYYWKGTPRRP